MTELQRLRIENAELHRDVAHLKGLLERLMESSAAVVATHQQLRETLKLD